jgi:hypothetical protein
MAAVVVFSPSTEYREIRYMIRIQFQPDKETKQPQV